MFAKPPLPPFLSRRFTGGEEQRTEPRAVIMYLKRKQGERSKISRWLPLIP